MRFLFTKLNKSNLYEQLGNIDVQRMRDFLSGFNEGEEMELIIRKKIKWDVSKMKKFFEGPVVDHVRNLYAENGNAVGKGVIREALKTMFLGYVEGTIIPISTMSLDHNKFWQFLRDIDAYCMDKFGCGLPSADTSDVE